MPETKNINDQPHVVQIDYYAHYAKYWEERCRAAEKFALFVPSCHWKPGSKKDIAYQNWQKLKNHNQ